MELGYSTIALLFPAIPLMFLVYSNTSTAVGARLRELFEAVSRGDVTGDEYNRVSEEAEYLAKRLSLLRSAQMLSGLTFLFNLLTLVSIYLEQQVFAQYLFGCAVIIMMLSILLYLMEISATVRAVGLILNKIKSSSKP
ncbi:MAG TPA: DUF2721 domain-containing protein [Rhodospirillales bacterium]|nr:DUF2721 domain-containing protein [Rhodospirillales bacterium]HIB20464.1 DUF2721 domain-containing protein [Rhodospirillales bacterium]HIC60790.1 DUF2721 domain-containing protein [Rhodospirillales bacterium]HIO37801.1 DUF2721 domain-containing protein [Rhodospirillales bacterium]HIP09452.1 DUF2721 domain-containing protein [Rhodospirillales bacterium]